MSAIAGLLQYLVAAGAGRSLAAVRADCGQDELAIRECLQRGLLELRGDCYWPTGRAREYLQAQRSNGSAAAGRWCPGCGRYHELTEFWKDATRPDGMYPYCAKFVARRKERVMQEKQQAAVLRIVNAAPRAVAAAASWDRAVAALAAAWSELVAVDVVLREARAAGAWVSDSGRLELRLLHPRALFALSIALTDAGFPMGTAVFRDCGMPFKLADYLGASPESDYLPAGATDLAPAVGGAGAPAHSHGAPRAAVKRAKRRKRKHRQQKRALDEPAGLTP